MKNKYKTKDPRFINQIIHKVNRSKRESTDNWSLPEPVGSIVFRGEHNQIKVDLHDGGDVAVNGVWVYTGFAFFE
ncbi:MULTISPECIES: hypothetical protein [Pontibacillus]|uniref:Uncharacterized protein n=1 Tax=Pontibacillus chungwhensis TaxID=265426 RepID=A0ABY8UYL0_9BACI|nr:MULTISPECIES: hypothetical protein [Pontibacillus]WIF96746.1 hypothetical protein QNI29_13415 [Pontibacillus chungwhensis]